MIVTTQGDRLRLVTQPDHARLASEVLALWRADGLPTHPRRRDLLDAVREHDNGWREPDAAPMLDRRGRPLDFRSAPDGLRRSLWRRGVERFGASRPYVALMTAQHALHLHQDRRDDPDWDETLRWLEERRTELMEETGIGEDELALDYGWLVLADGLSLALCAALDWVRWRGWQAATSSRGLELDPFPLAGATTFRIPCRSIPDRRYAGEADLAADLAGARWEDRAVRLVPPEGPGPRTA